MKPWAILVLLTSAMFGQTKEITEIQKARTALASMPSDSELSELTEKAAQKVALFRKAVEFAKPYLDQSDPHLAANYLDAAATAETIISNLKTKGFSAYGLTSLLATLDDVSLDGAVGSVYLLRAYAEKLSKGQAGELGIVSAVMSLTTAENACNDISELIMHANLRYIAAEETVLSVYVTNGSLPSSLPTASSPH